MTTREREKPTIRSREQWAVLTEEEQSYINLVLDGMDATSAESISGAHSNERVTAAIAERLATYSRDIPPAYTLDSWKAEVRRLSVRGSQYDRVKLAALELYAKVEGWLKPVETLALGGVETFYLTQLLAGVIGLELVPESVRDAVRDEYQRRYASPSPIALPAGRTRLETTDDPQADAAGYTQLGLDRPQSDVQS